MEQSPPVLESEGPLSQPPMSLGARLFNIFATPGEVFDQIKHVPVSAANWIVPAVIFIVVSWVGASLVFSQSAIQQQLKEITDQAIEKQIASQHLTDEKADQARAIGEKFGNIGTKISAYAAPVFIAVVVPFWWGLLLWLIGTKALGGDFSYMRGVEIAGLAAMISVLDGILRALLISIMGNLFASPSLALFVKQFDPQNPVHGLLAAVNIMTFWVLLIRSIGVARISGAQIGKAAAWVFGAWIAMTGIMAGFGFTMKALFSHLGQH